MLNQIDNVQYIPQFFRKIQSMSTAFYYCYISYCSFGQNIVPNTNSTATINRICDNLNNNNVAFKDCAF